MALRLQSGIRGPDTWPPRDAKLDLRTPTSSLRDLGHTSGAVCPCCLQEEEKVLVAAWSASFHLAQWSSGG